jgi:hypothetical protein
MWNYVWSRETVKTRLNGNNWFFREGLKGFEWGCKFRDFNLESKIWNFREFSLAVLNIIFNCFGLKTPNQLFSDVMSRDDET